jgi:tripartite-type tricarboxylate transporter receptor subunit TctC
MITQTNFRIGRQPGKEDPMKKVPSFSFGLVLGLSLFAFLGGVEAQEKYPGRPIELVVPFGPGGTADLAARAYSDDLSKLLKVPVNVVNRAGGTGIQGTSYVINGKKDGYTLLGTTDTPLKVMPIISKEVTYDPLQAVIPIGHLGYAPSVFAVKSDSPFKTLAELIDYARKNPGKLKNAASGFGTESFFNLQLLARKESIKITSIPFKGDRSRVALLGGHTDMASNTLASLGAQLRAGTVRGLAICAKKRHPDFPDMPTTAELGYPDLTLAVWTALFVPAGVSQQVLDVLVPAVEKTFKSPQVVERASNAGIVVEYLGPGETRKHLEAGIELVKKAAQEAEMAK